MICRRISLQNPSSLLIRAGLVLLMGVATLLGIHHLSHSLWHDEGLTLQIVQGHSMSDVLKGAMTLKPMPPLFFFLTRLSWQQIGGEAGLRWVSLFCGLLCLPTTYWLGARLWGAKTGLAAAWLLVATPGAFFYFVDANPYTFLMLAVSLSIIALLRAMETNYWIDWGIYSLLALLGLGVHTLFVFYLAAQWLVALGWVFRSGSPHSINLKNLERQGGQRGGRFILSVGLVAAAWLAWVFFYFKSGGFHHRPDFGRLFSAGTLFCLAGMIPGPISYGHWIQWCCFPLLLGAGTFRFWKKARDKRIQLILLWILPVVMITLFVQATQSFLGYRYGLGVFPITCLLMAIGGGLPWNRKNENKPKHVVIFRFMSILAYGVYLMIGLLQLTLAGSDFFTYQDWKGCASYLKSVAGSRDMIWFPFDQRAYPFRFYYPVQGEARLIWPPSPDHEAALSHLIDLGSTVLNKEGRIWVVEPQFYNVLAWVERFTRFPTTQSQNRIHGMEQNLRQKSKFSLHLAFKFKRINVWELVQQPAPGTDQTDSKSSPSLMR